MFVALQLGSPLVRPLRWAIEFFTLTGLWPCLALIGLTIGWFRGPPVSCAPWLTLCCNACSGDLVAVPARCALPAQGLRLWCGRFCILFKAWPIRSSVFPRAGFDPICDGHWSQVAETFPVLDSHNVLFHYLLGDSFWHAVLDLVSIPAACFTKFCGDFFFSV